MKAEWTEEDDRKLGEQIGALAMSSDAMFRALEKSGEGKWLDCWFSICDCRLCSHCTDLKEKECDLFGKGRKDPRYGCSEWKRRDKE